MCKDDLGNIRSPRVNVFIAPRQGETWYVKFTCGAIAGLNFPQPYTVYEVYIREVTENTILIVLNGSSTRFEKYIGIQMVEKVK